jgi:hypothetical protein
MKGLTLLTKLMAILLSVFSIALGWVFWPTVQGHLEIERGIQAIRRIKGASSIMAEQRYGADTFTNEISSQTIKDFYNRAAQELHLKDPHAKTYRWLDRLGWDRVSTVSSSAAGRIEVRAACSNDNDSIDILFTSRPFDHPDAVLLPHYQLPPGILRCDWSR